MHEQVEVSKKMVEVRGLMACHGGKGVMGSIQMTRRKSYFSSTSTSLNYPATQTKNQKIMLSSRSADNGGGHGFGAAAPHPKKTENNAFRSPARYLLMMGVATDPGRQHYCPWPPPLSADLDKSNSDREIGRHDFLVLVFGARSAAGSFAFGKMQSKGRSERSRAG